MSFDPACRATAMAVALLLITACGGSSSAPPPVPAFKILSATATPDTFDEAGVPTISLDVRYSVQPDSFEWRQVGGPTVPLVTPSASTATAEVAAFEVAVDTEFLFEISAVFDGVTQTATIPVVCRAMDAFPVPQAPVQIGGATRAMAILEAGQGWTLYNVGNRLSITPLATTAGPVYSVYTPGYIHDIELVTLGETPYALLAMGTEGIAVVDCSNPLELQVLGSVQVNYFQDGLMFAEGGGAILVDQEIASVTAPIVDLVTDGETLWLADEDYGIHRTALTNLMAEGGPVLEPDGTLLIDHEVYTLQYAGERPWGGPQRILLHEGKLFAAMGFLGLGIFDPESLVQVGRYHLYTDTSVEEDWFIDMEVADEVQPGFLDEFTGMPDYRQASFEILEVWKGDVEAPTPWADFDRYGKYYYVARDVAVADFDGRSIAYVAYGLGGLVAVDVTGYEEADEEEFLTGEYLGYAPGVPAHGPDKPIGEQSKSLYPYFGAGMLKEAGVVAVRVLDNRVFYTDHFAGLVILDDADEPEEYWHQEGAPFDNDDENLGEGVLGDHWPDYEFVTSYDMSPYDPTDHESLPTWMYEEPSILVTGEVGGHGNNFLFGPEVDLEEGGTVDVLLASGSGGLNLLDVLGFEEPDMLDRYTLLVNFPSTDEIGAAADGSPTETIAIGHTQGITASRDILYVGDGPHGVTAWRIADADGVPIDDLHVVANTLQDEYPVVVDEETIIPTPHAWGVVFEPVTESLYVLCQSLGLRRVDVAAVEGGAGAPGAPLLLKPQPTDLFEHNGEYGTVDGLQWQDHAYDVVMKGDLAFTADGSNGLTVYDVTKDPTVMDSGFVRANIGAGSTRPPLGRATGIALWTDPATAREYALMAAGPRGVGVVDVTDVDAMFFVKVFEPIKIEDDKVIHADGRCVDVQVVGDKAFFSYASFGIVAYAIADLIEPVPDGVDPLQIWFHQGEELIYDHRPVALAQFKLTNVPGYEDVDGEALYMEYTDVADRVVFYAAYGPAGVLMIDWTNAAAPQLLGVVPTVHEATAVAISNGRLYVADHDGGVLVCR